MAEMQTIISDDQKLMPPNPAPDYNYAQPAVTSPQTIDQNIANNQLGPPVPRVGIPFSEINSWGSMPHEINCPHCGKLITTEVETSCNMGSCCLCFWLSCVIWIIILLCMGKEIGCADAIHRCPECKNIIGSYRSC